MRYVMVHCGVAGLCWGWAVSQGPECRRSYGTRPKPDLHHITTQMCARTKCRAKQDDEAQRFHIHRAKGGSQA